MKGYIIKKSDEPEPIPREDKERTEIKRLPTGIRPLDDGLEGGIPLGAWVTISGDPGTGKTVLTQHVAYSALSNNFGVVVVSTEMRLWEWLTQAKGLGLNIDNYPIVRLKDVVWYNKEKKEYYVSLENAPKDFRTVFIDIYSLSHLAKLMGLSERVEKEHKGKEYGRATRWYSYLDVPVLSEAVDIAFRMFSENPNDEYPNLKSNLLLIVDSLSVFYILRPSLAAKIALDLMLRFKRNNVVALLTAHRATTTGSTFGFRVEHITDGVIRLWKDDVETVKEVRRHLIIEKMRATQHKLRSYRVIIEKGQGMILEPE